MERIQPLEVRIRDRSLAPLWDRVRSGGRLSLEDGERLFETDDLHAVGAMADWVKEQKTGDRATFVLNRQINPTNICVLSCRFCDFASRKGRPNAYSWSVEEVLSKCSPDLREVHIVGGLNREWSFEDYVAVVREIHRAFPAIQIKAYTAVEIDFFARHARISIPQVLSRLKEAGLSLLPGGGAEVFSERVRKALFPFKIGAPKWLEVHRVAHGMGLRSNATLLYGHMETRRERLEHMIRLRDLQEETGGFLSFIPLAYQPGMTRVVERTVPATEDLRTIAVSRLMLDNFDHIKAYWVTAGEETASVALNFGADDMDGTIMEEKIMHAANAPTPVGMTREKLVRLIRESGRVPAERDALYNVLRVFDESGAPAPSFN